MLGRFADDFQKPFDGERRPGIGFQVRKAHACHEAGDLLT
jgi:hypothetical protein